MNTRFAFAAAFALIAAPVVAAPVVINFDDLTGYQAIPDYYAGVHWADHFVSYDSPQDPYNPSSGATRVFGNYDVYGYTNGPITFEVGAGSVFDGFYVAGRDTPLFYELYEGGLLVATSATVTTTSTPTFLASGYTGTIDEVRITTQNGQWVGDDFTFSNLTLLSAVPEPASWALMIGGFGMVGASLRRRRVLATA